MNIVHVRKTQIYVFTSYQQNNIATFKTTPFIINSIYFNVLGSEYPKIHEIVYV